MSIKKVTLHRFYNDAIQGPLARNIGCGTRTVIALPAGRKWQTLVDPFTLDVATIALREWQAIKPAAVECRRHVIVDAMKNRMQYFQRTDEKGKSYSTLTQAQKDAYALVRS